MTMKERLQIMAELLKRNCQRDAEYANNQKKTEMDKEDEKDD